MAGLQVFGCAISEATGTGLGNASATTAGPVAGSPAAQQPDAGSDGAVSGASPRSETRSFSERAGKFSTPSTGRHDIADSDPTRMRCMISIQVARCNGTRVELLWVLLQGPTWKATRRRHHLTAVPQSPPAGRTAGRWTQRRARSTARSSRTPGWTTSTGDGAAVPRGGRRRGRPVCWSETRRPRHVAVSRFTPSTRLTEADAASWFWEEHGL